MINKQNKILKKKKTAYTRRKQVQWIEQDVFFSFLCLYPHPAVVAVDSRGWFFLLQEPTYVLVEDAMISMIFCWPKSRPWKLSHEGPQLPGPPTSFLGHFVSTTCKATSLRIIACFVDTSLEGLGWLRKPSRGSAARHAAKEPPLEWEKGRDQFTSWYESVTCNAWKAQLQFGVLKEIQGCLTSLKKRTGIRDTWYPAKQLWWRIGSFV